MTFTYVTLVHTFETAGDVAASGTVEFSPVAPMQNSITVIAAPVKATLTVGGALSQRLAANTDPDTTPTGTTYKVTERLTGQPVLTYFVQVPHDRGAALDLRDLAGWQGAAVGGGTGTGSVNSVNGIDPDSAGNVVLSASDVGAQLASSALTRLAAAPQTLTAVSGVITPNAALGVLFRHDAAADVALAAPTGPSDGQPLEVQVYASGADRVLSLPNGLTAVTIPAGTTWWGRFSYRQTRDEWLLDDDAPGGTGGGSGYTDEQVRDVVGATLVAGPNVVITPNDVGDTITIAAATSGASGIPASIVDAKGDLIVATANDTVARQSVGADGLALVANSGNTSGLGWAAPTPAAHTHAGTDLTSGIVAAARLGSGAPSATLFLRGDSAWADPSLLAPPVHAVGNSGSALTVDASAPAGYVKTITLTGNCTFTLSGAAAGRATTLELILTQDGTGSRTVTWPSSVRWSGGAPTLSTAASATDRVVLTSYNGGTTWYGDLVGKGYA